MSTANFHEEDQRVVLNGPRPSPLKVNRNSHAIQKPSSSYPVSMNISNDHVKETKKQKRLPVITYTCSPKIIHTKPRDFMALVKELTGSSRSEKKTDQGADIDLQSRKQECGNGICYEDNDSSSVTSEGENNKGLKPHKAEIPLFTPNLISLFFPPQGSFRNSNMVVPSPSPSPSPGISGSLSPSFVELFNMKELPEYLRQVYS